MVLVVYILQRAINLSNIYHLTEKKTIQGRTRQEHGGDTSMTIATRHHLSCNINIRKDSGCINTRDYALSPRSINDYYASLVSEYRYLNSSHRNSFVLFIIMPILRGYLVR